VSPKSRENIGRFCTWKLPTKELDLNDMYLIWHGTMFKFSHEVTKFWRIGAGRVIIIFLIEGFFTQGLFEATREWKEVVRKLFILEV